ncbi:MAG: hypothetical protein AB8D78_14530 [Akkermansiaceae bacterium]
MNWNYFNTLGYVSVILWISIPVLWFLHSRMKPRRWLVHIAVLVGIISFVLASINSRSHVGRIQQDQTEQLAQIQAEQEAKRQAAIDSRGDEVADIRFAEDSSNDFLDRAGMDESDLKYMDKQLGEDGSPAWKKQKRERSSGGGEDAGLEDLIGAEEETEGVVSEELDKTAEAEPIVMSAKDMTMANRLDSLNLKAIRFMILLALILVVVDYLRRVNVYRESYLPLPLPGPWTNSITPVPAVEERPASAKRSIPEELERFTKRGEVFLYLTDDTIKSRQLPDSMPKVGKKGWQTELIRFSEGDHELSKEFVFESLWYGRASFVVDSATAVKSVLDDFQKRLEKRKIAKAKVRETVHIVWDLAEPISEDTLSTFSDLGTATGFSIFLDQHSKSSP